MKKFGARIACGFFVLGLSGCPTGNWGNTDGMGQGNLEPCSTTTEVFETGGASQVYAFMQNLPAGIYLPANFEVYIENPTPSPTQTSITRVQTLETYSTDAANITQLPNASLSLRCEETQGAFNPYSLVNGVTVPVGLNHFNNGNFDVVYRTLELSYVTSTNVQAGTVTGGMNRSEAPSNIDSAIRRYWQDYKWLHRTGNTYEFQGYRVDGTKKISVKAAFVRRDLPIGSP